MMGISDLPYIKLIVDQNMRVGKGLAMMKAMGRMRYMNTMRFCKRKQQMPEQKKQNPVFKFLKDGWRQTFPKDQDEVKRKYQKVKQMKRYSQEELKKMQQEIPEYQRTAMVQTETKVEEEKKRFKISSMIPDSLKDKVKKTDSYKQYADFRQNLKDYIQTSDSAAVNLGNKAYKVVSQPSSAAKATNTMRQYDKDFSVIELEKESTYIFLEAYQAYLEGDTEKLDMLCGGQCLDLLKSLLKLNATKKVRPKYTQILHHNKSTLKKTVMTETSLPSFQFQMNIMEIYCVIDNEGKIIDGDDERIMDSTYYFVLKYSGQFIGQLGHPWQIVEMQKVNEVKMLV